MMLPSTERQLFAEFLNRAVAKIGRKNYHLSIHKLSRDDQALIITIKEYEKLMGRQITHNPFDLFEDEFERVMGLLVSKEFTLHNLAFRLNLSMRIEIDSWSIRGKVSETQSMMAWNYGTSPHISMSCFLLRFDELEGFPVGVFEDVAIEEAEGADGLLEKRFGLMFLILHGNQISPHFFFVDLFNQALEPIAARWAAPGDFFVGLIITFT